jgi:transposase
MQYLQEEGVFSYVFPWPAGSPDANPIEKLWDLMKQEVSVRPTKDTLIAAFLEEWDRLAALGIGELNASSAGNP